MLKFLIMSQPRSQSKWLSQYLSFGDQKVGHDLSMGCKTLDEFVSRTTGYDGTVETSLVLGYEVLRNLFPETKFGTLSRPVYEIGASFNQIGLEADWPFLLAQDLMISSLAWNESGVLSISKRSLSSKMIRFNVAEYLTGRIPDESWDKSMDRNIQVPAPEIRKNVEQNVRNSAALIWDIARRVSELRARGLEESASWL